MPDTLPMKVLTVVSVAIVVVDFEVLRRTFIEYFQLKHVLENEPYQQCYKPQAHLRIVFQCYAIFAALICTTLTSMLALKCTDQFVETVARFIINLCFLIFGPVLLTFVNYGFVHFKQLAFVCTPRGASHRINFLDIILILICFILALCVTFTMAMQKTLDMAQQSFQDESSLIYRLASLYFSYQVRQTQERDRQQLQQRVEERREQRRLRRAEREQILTAFQNQHPEITLPGQGSQRTPESQCPQPNSASSQASTVALNVPQRTLDGQIIRSNRGLADMQRSEEPVVDGPLQTMFSSQTNKEHLLEEDLDEEMESNFQINDQRAANNDPYQTSEERLHNNLSNKQTENHIYKSQNRQLQANDISPINFVAHTATLHIHGDNYDSKNDVKEASLYMRNEEQKEEEMPQALIAKNTEELNYTEGEQMIKDTKTSSGVSSSQASTNINTHAGSHSSVAAAAATSSQNANHASDPNQKPSVGAVPPSNFVSGQSEQDSLNHLDQRSDIAFQSIDGTSEANTVSFKQNNQQNKDKKEKKD